MSATKLCEKPCETCQKQGLPILLTRYAVLTDDSRAPKLSGHLNNTALNDIPLTGQAHYGLRLLRTGYVYVYDEARKRMDEYFVTTDGFLTKMPMRQIMLKNAQHKPATEFACARNGFAPIAGLITIPKPQYATTIWISFSDAAWTNKTYLDHMDTSKAGADLRKQHMQNISIQAGTIAPQLYTAPIEEVSQHVAEFNKQTIISSFAKWSPFAFNKRIESESFKKAIKTACPESGAAIVALHDPVGVAAELDTLMLYYPEQFMTDDKRKRELVMSDTVAALERGVKLQARTDKEKEAEEKAMNKIGLAGAGAMIMPGTLGSITRRNIDVNDVIVPVTEPEALEAENDAWKKYKDKLNNAELKKWRDNLQTEFLAFDHATIAPLAKAHAMWMQSIIMQNCFNCNYDETSPESGLAYTALLSQCIGSTQDKKACADLYEKWLLGKVDDKTNLLLRSLILNQQKTAQDIVKAVEVSLDWRGLPSDPVLNNFAKTTELQLEGKEIWVSKLVVAVGGAIIKCLGKPLEGRLRHFMVCLSLHTMKSFTQVKAVGTKADFKEYLIRQITRLNPQLDINGKKLRRALNAELRRMKGVGINPHAPDEKHFLMLNDPENFKPLANNANLENSIKHTIEETYHINQMKALEVGEWQARIRNPLKATVKGGIPYVTGMITAFLQLNAYNKLTEDDAKAMKHEAKEISQRKMAGMGALIGTLAELTGQALQHMVPIVPKLVRGLISQVGVILKGFGKVLGLLGAAVGVYWDYQQGMQNYKEGSLGLAATYFALVAMGAGLTVIMVLPNLVLIKILSVLGIVATESSITGVGIFLALAIVAITIWLEYFKDNKVQDWLERTTWGNLTDDRYGSLEEELAQLKIALGQ